MGHWFERLYSGLSKSQVNISKAMGTKEFEYRAAQLSKMGITKDNYYVGTRDGAIPERFFDNIDAVYISSPNSLHFTQTMQSLRKGKYAIVEKALATNERDFRNVLRYIAKSGIEKRVYLHLHYMHKQLVLAMPGILAGLTKEYGRIRSASGTFFEKISESDKRRKWLFSMSEGGLFMDWIHPYEVLFYGALAKQVKLDKANLFIMDKDFGSDASGIETVSSIKGKYFASGAMGSMRIAKGAKESIKSVVFGFDDGIRAEFIFLSSEEEFGTGKRGTFRLLQNKAGKEIGIRKYEASGPDTSEIFAKDIESLCCDGPNPGLSMDEIKKLYGPQWEFQRITNGVTPESGIEEVESFVRRGEQHI